VGSSKSFWDDDGHSWVLWVPAEQVQRDLWVMSRPVTYVQVTAIRLAQHSRHVLRHLGDCAVFRSQIRSQGACRVLLRAAETLASRFGAQLRLVSFAVQFSPPETARLRVEVRR
jgi:hypothetical protein